MSLKYRRLVSLPISTDFDFSFGGFSQGCRTGSREVALLSEGSVSLSLSHVSETIPPLSSPCFLFIRVQEPSSKRESIPRIVTGYLKTIRQVRGYVVRVFVGGGNLEENGLLRFSIGLLPHNSYWTKS